jgi:hypothetical protein
MPRMSKADAPVSLDEPEIEGRYAELGEYTVAFETHKTDMDPAPFFGGLPDDRCQCPHYGAPGHLPLMFGGTELVEFSPTASLNETMAVVGKNLDAARAGGA